MPEIVATITSKGQITIPAEVRRNLGVGKADKVAFVLNEKGWFELRPVRYTLESLLGSIQALPNESPDFEREIDEAMQERADQIVRRMQRG